MLLDLASKGFDFAVALLDFRVKTLAFLRKNCNFVLAFGVNSFEGDFIFCKSLFILIIFVADYFEFVLKF